MFWIIIYITCSPLISVFHVNHPIDEPPSKVVTNHAVAKSGPFVVHFIHLLVQHFFTIHGPFLVILMPLLSFYYITPWNISKVQIWPVPPTFHNRPVTLPVTVSSQLAAASWLICLLWANLQPCVKHTSPIPCHGLWNLCLDVRPPPSSNLRCASSSR